MFRFPKEENVKQVWISAIPNANLTVSKDTVICELHWPSEFETISINGKLRPRYPPSVWPNVPSSQIPTPALPLRTTKRALCSHRNREEDQLAVFLEQDTVSFCEMKDTLLQSKRDLPVPVITYMDESVLIVQSETFEWNSMVCDKD